MRPSPPDLPRLQRALGDILTDPAGVRAAVKDRSEEQSWIVDAPPIDAVTRLSVYGDGYFLRLLEALSSDFPAVKRALGDDNFRVLVANYLQSNHSTSPTLADLGQAFPDFVGSHSFARKHPFLPDLARLERAVMTRLFAGRLPILDPEALRKIKAEDWSGVRLILDSTVQLLAVSWPVERLWRRRELSLKTGGRTIRRPCAQWLLLFRDETWVRVVDISRQEWEALRAIKEGARLGEVFVRVSDPGATSAAEVQRWFSSWVAGGIIKGIRISGDA